MRADYAHEPRAAHAAAPPRAALSRRSKGSGARSEARDRFLGIMAASRRAHDPLIDDLLFSATGNARACPSTRDLGELNEVVNCCAIP